MAKYYPVGGKTYVLASSIGSTDTTIQLSSFLEPVTGTPLTMALMNSDVVFGTLGPKTASSEFISFTGVTQNSDGTATLTGVTRGLGKIYPFTTSSSYKVAHSGQSLFILSDAPQVFNKYAALINDQTFTGDNTFSLHSPTIPTEAASETNRAASIAYVNAIAIAGAADASTTVKGIVEEATQAENDARTTAGGTAARLFINPGTLRATKYSDYVASDTGSANAYAIAPTPAITAYAAGQVFIFKAANANTTASTLNVSALGVISIKKLASTTLVANDILANQIIVVVYDGTNMVMVNPVGRDFVDLTNNQTVGGVKTFSGSASQFTALPQSSAVPGTGNDLVNKTYVDGLGYLSFKDGATTKAVDDASTTQTIAHGLGRIPKFIEIEALGFATNGGALNEAFFARSVYNGTTQSSQSYYTVAAPATDFRLGDLTSSTASKYQVGVITADATNISIAWTRTSTPSGTFQLLWKAFG